MYVAKCYVKVEGTTFIRGEIIPNVPADKIERLLRLGAVTLLDEENDAEKHPGIDADSSEQETDNEPEADDTSKEGGVAEADDTPKEGGAADSEPEIPTIDITDGIIADPSKPKKKGKRK